MSALAISQEGQTLDDIVFAHYGLAPQMLEPVINANLNILGLGIHLPAGVQINLPTIDAAPPRAQIVNLWD